MSIIRLGGLSRRLGGRATALAVASRGKGRGGSVGAFSTTFTATESPIGSPFIVGSLENGLTPASGPVTTGGSPGICYAPATDRIDYIAAVPGMFNPVAHWSQITVRRVGGYTAPATHEIEALVAVNLSSGVCNAYESDCWFAGSQCQQVRWEPPLGTFNVGVFTVISDTWPGVLVDGDVVRVEFDSRSGSPVITVKLNNSPVIQVTDTTAGKIMSGSPGFGFFLDAGVTPTSYCIKGFDCGSL